MAHLAPNTFIAQIDGRAIVLDLRQDRYQAFGPKLAAALDLATTGFLTDDTVPPHLKTAWDVLFAKGVLVEQPAPRQWCSAALPGLPTETLWPSLGPAGSPDRFRLEHAMAVFVALLQAWGVLRLFRFERVVAHAAERLQRPIQPRPDWSAQRVLDLYFAWRPWFPVKPICRLDALALALVLHRFGCNARLVFGVKLEPFRAHCWVQQGFTVINEPHDYVLELTPILAV